MVTSALLLASLLLPQQPTPAANAPARLDLVELQSGELLQGRLVTQLPDYLEIEVSPGAIVGCSRAQVKSVRPGAGPEPGAVAASALQPYDDWFLLHDGSGTPVGWLHSSLGVGSDGGLRLAEEWQFEQGDKRVAVTQLEHATATLQPLSSYYHERVVEASRPHVTNERIVDAQLHDGTLTVQRLTGNGRDERRIEAPSGMTFPLLLRQHCRTALLGGMDPEAAVSIYDAVTEELRQSRVQKPLQRTVDIDGQAVEITELAAETETGRNVEWLDAAMRTLRREIAGPTLVAVPSDMETAQAAAAVSQHFPSALACEAGRRFGLWAPNPSWQAPAEAQANQVVLDCELQHGRASLVLIDHLDAGTELDTATAAVQRWLQLLHPEMTFGDSSAETVRDRQARKLGGEPRGGADGLLVEVHVLPWNGKFLALSLQAPKQHWGELQNDFAAMLRTIELDQAGIEPAAQGPLLRQARAGRQQTIAPGVPPVDPAHQPAGGVVGLSPDVIAPKPSVRVPRDQ